MTYQPRDAYYRRAKKEGYRSRAAYKLSEINRRFRLMKPGDRVVDLGAAPGGWLQVASQLIGPGGKVVGVDIQPIEPLDERSVFLLQWDINSEACLEQVKGLLGSPGDCVLSDLSPRLSGIRDADLSRSVELARTALRIARALLKPGGSLLIKTFMGPEAETLVTEMKGCFEAVKRTRPEATRRGSSEIYIIARGFHQSANRKS